MKTLKEISQDIQIYLEQLQQESESPENQDSANITELLSQLSLAEDLMKDKVDSIIYVLKDMQAMAKAKQELADEYKASAMRWEAKATSLKNYLMLFLDNSAETKYRSNKHLLTITRNSQAKLIIHAEVPPSYLTTVTKQAEDKDKIKEALQQGIELPFAYLEQGKHLRIK